MCLQLALYVLTFLAPRDLLQAAQTCRYWRILAEDNLLWREKCREEGKHQQPLTTTLSTHSTRFGLYFCCWGFLLQALSVSLCRLSSLSSGFNFVTA